MAEKKYVIGLDLTQLNRDVATAKTQFNSIGNSAVSEGKRIDDVFSSIGRTITGVLTTAAITSFGQQMIKVRGEIQLLEQSFEVLTGSAEKSKDMLSEIIDLATNSPLEMTPVAKAAQTLMGFGIASEDVMGILRQLSDVSMGNQQRFESLALVYAQTQAAGKLMGQDLLQYINIGFNPLSIIAEQTGKSLATLTDEMSDGAISAQMVADAFTSATSEGGKFYEMTVKQADTIVGVKATFEDSIVQMFNSLGEKNEEFIKGGYEMATSVVQNYETIGKALGVLIATYGTYKAAIIANIAIQKIASVASNVRAFVQLTASIKSAKDAQILLNMATKANPYVLLATAVGTAFTAFWAFSSKVDDATASMQRFNEEQEKLRGDIDSLIGVIQSETATMYQKVKAYDELTLKSKALTDAYSMEALATLKSADAQALLNQERDAKEYEEIVKQVDAARKSVEMYKDALSSPQMVGGVIARGESLANSIGLDRAQKYLDSAEKLLDEYNKRVTKAQQIAKNGVRLEGIDANITLLTKETSTLAERNTAYEKLKELSPELASMYDQEAISLMSLAQAQEAASRAEQIATLRKEKMTNEGVISNMESSSLISSFMGNPLQGVIDDIKLQNTSIDQQIADLLSKPLTATTTGNSDSPLAGTIKAYEEDNKRLAKLQKETVQNSEQYNVYQRQIDANSLKIAQINGAAQQELADATLKVQEDAQEAELALKRSQITDKIALIKLDTQEQLDAIEAQKQAFMEKYKGQEDTQEYKSGISAFDSLSTSISEQAKVQEAQINKDAEKENQEYLNDLYEQYATYEKQRLDIQEEYKKKRDALIADGAEQGVIDNLNKQEEADLKDVDDSAFDSLKSGASVIAQLFEDTANKSKEQLDTLRSETEALLTYLATTEPSEITAGFGMSAEQLKSLLDDPDKLKAIKDAFDDIEESQNAFSKLGADFTNLFSEGGFNISNMQDFNSSLNSVMSMVTNVTGALSDMFEASGNEKGAEIVAGIEQGLTSVSNIASGFASGGIIGGAMAAVSELISGFATAAAVEAEHQAKLEEIRESAIAQQEEYNDLLREQNLLYEEGNNLLASDDYGTATNAISQAKEDLASLNEDIAALSKVEIATGSYTTGAWFWKEQHTTYTDLLELYPDLIDANGQLDAELAQSILDTGEMSEEHEELLQNAIDSYADFQESIAVMTDYISELFGGMGSSLMDSLVEAFEAGESAADDFLDSVSGMLEDFVSDMVYSLAFADYFNDASAKISAIQTGYDTDGTANEYANMTDEEKLEAQMAVLADLYDAVDSNMDYANSLLEKAQELGDSYGYSLYSDDDRTSTSSTGITASQESVDSVDGRLTVMQGHTYTIAEKVTEIAALMNSMTGKVSYVRLTETSSSNTEYDMSSIGDNIQYLRDNAGRILDVVTGIKGDTARLKAIENYIGEVKSSVADVKTSLGAMETKGLKLRT